MNKLLKNKWVRIAFYYVIALSTSFIFRLNVLNLDFDKSIYSDLIIGLLGAFGPFLAGLFMRNSVKSNKYKISFLGFFKWKSVALILIPAICFGFFGAKNGLMNSHLFGLLLGLYIVIYGILEETGWRGYLQQEFIELKPILKYLIVACFWYTWHLTFLGKTTFVNELVIFAILFGSSIGIGIVADRTQSIIYASCFHIIGNIVAFSSEISTYFPINFRLITISVSLIIWMIAFQNLKEDMFTK